MAGIFAILSVVPLGQVARCDWGLNSYPWKIKFSIRSYNQVTSWKHNGD